MKRILADKKLLTDQSFSIDSDKKLYLECDCSVWLRSCEAEIFEPIKGQIQGQIPRWLNGNLMRNGPGKLEVGETKFQHLFDSAALIHKYTRAFG